MSLVSLFLTTIVGLPLNVDFDSNDADDDLSDDEEENEKNLPDLGPEDISDERVYNKEAEMQSFIPGKVNSSKESDVINEEVLKSKIHDWNVGSTPFNEFCTENLASLAFPTLFPDGKGDPTNSSSINNISNNDTEAFADKIKHLIKFAEKIDNQWVYRFAAHPRFAFWAYNMLYRRRLLGQGNFYLKQNPGDANVTLEELQDMVRSGTHETVMKKLMRYSKNVSGTVEVYNQSRRSSNYFLYVIVCRISLA